MSDTISSVEETVVNGDVVTTITETKTVEEGLTRYFVDKTLIFIGKS